MIFWSRGISETYGFTLVRTSVHTYVRTDFLRNLRIICHGIQFDYILACSGGLLKNVQKRFKTGSIACFDLNDDWKCIFYFFYEICIVEILFIIFMCHGAPFGHIITPFRGQYVKNEQIWFNINIS